MKALSLYGAIALSVIACNRPDSAIFGPDSPDDSEGGSSTTGPSGGSPPLGSGASGGSVSTGGSANSTNGGSTSGGPTGGGSTNGGSTSGGGTDSGGGSAGDGSEPGGAGPGPGTDPPPAPVCGNGVLEAGEQCDDGGESGEDGCQDCRVQCAHFGSGAVKSDDHHCYVGFDEADFEGAASDCKERGGHLVTISSATENTLVRGLVNNSKFIGAWEDVDVTEYGEGNYAWVTGEAFTYTNWAAREPNQATFACSGWLNERCYEHCVLMTGQGTWQDHRCDQRDGYVCEWEPAGAVK